MRNLFFLLVIPWICSGQFEQDNLEIGNQEIKSIEHGNVVVWEKPTSGDEPLIVDHTTNFDVGPTETITATKPSGVSSGNILVIAAGNDWNNDTPAQFDDGLNKPSGGFTLIKADGGTSGDAFVAAWHRTSDGGEGASETVQAETTGSNQMWTAYLNISGASGIGAVGTTLVSTGGTSHVVPALTTTAAKSMVVTIGCFDGSDTNPFSADNGWIELAEIDGSTDDGGYVAGVIYYKIVANIGTSGDCTITSDVGDGGYFYQFEVLKL